MADADPWAGMVNPRAALKAAREAAKTLAGSSPSYSSGRRRSGGERSLTR